jgi:hypothetical protein
MDNYGVNFAPTQENAQRGPMQGQIDGIPAALKILALRMPRFLGANAPTPLLSSGAQGGVDPIASAVLATMARTVGAHNIGLPGGTAGPNPPEMRPSPTMPGTLPAPGSDPGVGAGVPPIRNPGFVYQPNPGGTAGPGPGPVDRTPFLGTRNPRRFV